MLISDTYRLLAPEERILPGDQFKFGSLPDTLWAPCEQFVGHRVREFQETEWHKVQFRRLIVQEIQ